MKDPGRHAFKDGNEWFIDPGSRPLALLRSDVQHAPNEISNQGIGNSGCGLASFFSTCRIPWGKTPRLPKLAFNLLGSVARSGATRTEPLLFRKFSQESILSWRTASHTAAVRGRARSRSAVQRTCAGCCSLRRLG